MHKLIYTAISISMYLILQLNAVCQYDKPQIREYKVILEEGGDSLLAIGAFRNGDQFGVHRYFNPDTGQEVGFDSLTVSGKLFYSEFSAKEFNYIYELDTLTEHSVHLKLFKTGFTAQIVSEYFDSKNQIEILKSYHPNGILEKCIYFVNGKLNGLLSEYFPSGILKSSVAYDNGIMDGPNLEYFENGNIKMNSYYKNGNLHGEKVIYSMDGSKIVQYYEFGKLIY